jgi:hypothetical protein
MDSLRRHTGVIILSASKNVGFGVNAGRNGSKLSCFATSMQDRITI